LHYTILLFRSCFFLLILWSFILAKEQKQTSFKNSNVKIETFVFLILQLSALTFILNMFLLGLF